MKNKKKHTSQSQDDLEVSKDLHISSERLDSLFEHYKGSGDELANDIIANIASHPNISINLIKIFVNYNRNVMSDYYAKRIVCNKAALNYDYIVELLANHKDPFIRSAIACKSKLIHVLEKLSNDEDYDVRLSCLYNENVPVDIIKKLRKDDDLRVSEQATEMLYEMLK